MSPPYLSFGELLRRVDQPYRSAFERLLAGHRDLFRAARSKAEPVVALGGGW